MLRVSGTNRDRREIRTPEQETHNHATRKQEIVTQSLDCNTSASQSTLQRRNRDGRTTTHQHESRPHCRRARRLQDTDEGGGTVCCCKWGTGWDGSWREGNFQTVDPGLFLGLRPNFEGEGSVQRKSAGVKETTGKPGQKEISDFWGGRSKEEW